MRSRHPLSLALLVVSTLSFGCGGKQVAGPPEPLGDTFPLPPPAADSVARETARAEPAPVDGERRVILEQGIHFEYNRWSLSGEARAILEAKAKVLSGEPQIRVRVEGHADERGSDEYNLVLSQKRAGEARRYLIQLGIDAGRIEAIGLGEECPVDTGENETAWAANRRAEFRITTGSPPR